MMFPDAVAGPVLYAALPAKDIHMFGELHHIMGTKGTPVTQAIVNFAKAHKDKRIAYVIEANSQSLQLYASSIPPPSPLKLLAKDLLNISYLGKLPPNIQISMVDVRYSPPFHMLQATVDFDTYANIFLRGDREDYIYARYAEYMKIKQLEKAVLSGAMKSRKACGTFMMSLVDPDVPSPKWLTDVAGLTNPLKDLMRTLKRDYPTFSQKLRQIFHDELDRLVMRQPKFSAAMELANKKRHTKSARLVADKSAFLRAFMVMLQSVFMDVYAFGKIVESSHTHDAVVYLAGANHVQTIAKFLPATAMVHAISPDGNLDLSQAGLARGHPEPMPGFSPNGLLGKFMDEGGGRPTPM